MKRLGPGLILVALAFAWLDAGRPAVAQELTFKVHPPGALKDAFGYATADYTLYAQGMRFPIATVATLNSQIKNAGGMYGPPGGQCSGQNYNEEWWDTFCEKRDASRKSYNCTSSRIHQGVDIRGGTLEQCKQHQNNTHKLVPIVAVYDGVIDHVGSYTVDLNTDKGLFRYLHMDMKNLAFSSVPHRVKAGDTIGYLWNSFGSSPTTFHLHFEHHMTFPAKGQVPVPIYCDLVLAYERDRGKRHVMLGGGRRCDGTPESAPQDTPTNGPVTPPTTAEGPATPPTAPTGGGGPATAPPAAHSYWTHNGSRMRLVADGDKRSFYYEEPREGLRDVAPPGTLLFAGEKTDSGYKGTAYVFKTGCPPTGFSVSGSVENEGRRVVLRGASPVPGSDCQATRTRDDSLIFVFQTLAQPSVPPTTPTAPGPVAHGGGSTGGNGTAPPTTGPAQGPLVVPPPPAPAAAIPPLCTRDVCVDREPFLAKFNEVYRSLTRRVLNRWQIDAVTSLVNVWDTSPDLVGKERLAYILGTVFHESTTWLYPTRECSCRTNAGAIACSKRLYDHGKAGYKYFLREPPSGHAYYGRGQTQLTLKENFLRVGQNLKMGDRLMLFPDEAMRFDVSARNSVLGLYHGWYRAGNALKTMSFNSDADWVRARDVLIGKGVAARDVASYGRKFLATLSFIPRAEFDRKYAVIETTPAPPPSVPAPPSSPQSPTAPAPTTTADAAPPEAPAPATNDTAAPATPTAPAPSEPSAPTTPATSVALPPPVIVQPPPAAQPAATPSDPVAEALLQRLAREARDLDTIAGDLATRVNDLARKIAVLRTLAELRSGDARAAFAASLKSAAPDASAGLKATSGGAAAGLAAAAEPQVDFLDVWPPGHKESNWCRVSGDEKAALQLDTDDPVYQLYFKPDGQ